MHVFVVSAILLPRPSACPPADTNKHRFWIHRSIGGSDQMYMTPFVCHVTGATNTHAIGRPRAPVNCESNPAKCVQGAKNPMYWKNKEGNNMPEPGQFAPTYSTMYGFREGAQHDMFDDASSN